MAYSLAGVVGIGLTVGGATYALFTSSVENTSNQFTAGTLKITAKRDDIPNVGPMFYSDTASHPGMLPTSEWAPGDKNTRGLFLKNDGTLPAKLLTLTANAADKDGNAVNTGSDYEKALQFAAKSHVLIWQIKWLDPSGGWIPNMKLDSTQLDAIMTTINDAYKAWTVEHPDSNLDQFISNADGFTQLMTFANQYLLDHISTIQAAGKTIKDGDVKVTKIYYKKLSNLLNKDADVSRLGISTNPGDAELLGFTVELDKDADNSYQGITANFNFGTDWVQVRNN